MRVQGLSFLRLDARGLIALLYDAPEFPLKLDVRALPLLSAAAAFFSRSCLFHDSAKSLRNAASQMLVGMV